MFTRGVLRQSYVFTDSLGDTLALIEEIIARN